MGIRLSKAAFSLDNSKIKWIVLALIPCLLPFQINLGNLVLIIAVAYNFFFFKKQNIKKFKSPGFIFPCFFFIIALISSLFSKKYEVGLKHLDLDLLQLLLAFVVINQSFDKERVNKLFDYFFYACSLSSAILLFNNFLKVLSVDSNEILFFHDFTLLYDQHPVYYSIYISLALFFKFYNTKSFSSLKKRDILLASLLLLALVFCASKIVLFIDLCFVLVFILTQKISLKNKMLFVLPVIMLSLTVFNIPYIKERFVEGLDFDTEIIHFEPTNDFQNKKLFIYEEKANISDLELRYIFVKIGLYHLIQDGKLLFGYGQGDTQLYLDYYYYSYNLGPNWFEGFNVHNQYLNILLNYGIFVLLAFLGYLLYSFWIAFKYRDIPFVFFLVISSLVFIVEVMLTRNKGIILFYFFNTFFLFKNLRFENSNIRNTRST
ncbi:O-antigen ligase family protein [Flavobacteriaceae bacterium KMM 6897]|nr:O-antigen ligase family protein [Flavobacteriaceae bacterium KMM 6897]